MDRYFAEIVISCEVGVPKPSAVIFSRAAEALRLSPGEILHVGDDAIADVEGASAAGFKGVFLDRAGVTSVGQVCDLRELQHQV